MRDPSPRTFLLPISPTTHRGDRQRSPGDDQVRSQHRVEMHEGRNATAGPASRWLRWLVEVPLCRLGEWVFMEESDHLARSMGPRGIGVGATRASTRPRVAGPVDPPLLQDAPPARVLV